MSKIAILTVCDYNYLFHFETFFKGFILNETNKNVYLEHFYVYKNENEINIFKDKYKILENFNRININFILWDKSYSEIRIFAGHYRMTAMQNLIKLKKYNKMLYLDVDSVINKSVFKICDEIKESFGVFLRVNQQKNRCEKLTNTKVINNEMYSFISYNKIILSGAIFCKCDIKSEEIVNKFINIFNNTDNIEWQSDQIILGKIFIEYVNKIDIYILPRLFLDFYCEENTNIHFCKGCSFSWKRDEWTKIISDTYINFFKKYLYNNHVCVYKFLKKIYNEDYINVYNKNDTIILDIIKAPLENNNLLSYGINFDVIKYTDTESLTEFEDELIFEFECKIKNIEQKKIYPRIYTGKKWIVFDKELSTEYEKYYIKENFYFTKERKWRISSTSSNIEQKIYFKNIKFYNQ